jgi:hypothetical protein
MRENAAVKGSVAISPKDAPQAQEARSALHKHAAKVARAAEEEADRRQRQLADAANEH